MFQKVFLLVSIIFLCTSCSFTGNQTSNLELSEQELEEIYNKNDVGMEKYGYRYTKSYLCKEIPISKKIQSTSDLTYNDGKLYIVSDKDHKVFICDTNGNILDTIGKIGSDKGELLEPQQIFVRDGKIYIAEKGNARIQIFNSNKESIGMIKIGRSLDEGTTINDLFVDEKNQTYLNFRTMQPDLQKIFMYDSKGKANTLGEKMIGVFGYDEKKKVVYFAQTNEVIEGFIKFGRNNFYKLKDGAIIAKEKLPNGLAPVLIAPTDREMFIHSESYYALEKFTKDGKYIETLYHPKDIRKEPDGDSTFCRSKDNEFYQCKKENKRVFRYYPK